jgi:PIN domain nuclease of toxin-antitoxin system
MNEVILDASALLAFLNQEKGSEIITQYLDRSAMSSINLSEVIAKLVDRNMPEDVIQELVSQLKIDIIPVDQEQAVTAGFLRSQTRSMGLSLGDRICLALGLQLNLPVLTTDRAWEKVSLSIEVRLIR